LDEETDKPELSESKSSSEEIDDDDDRMLAVSSTATTSVMLAVLRGFENRWPKSSILVMIVFWVAGSPRPLVRVASEKSELGNLSCGV
jgi:hypothetical protein